jgi:hypothetical protein
MNGSFEEKLKEINETSARKLAEISNKFTGDMEKQNLELKEKFKKLDDDLEGARTLSRDTLHKLILLATSIVGFSITVVSTNLFNQRANFGELKLSWYIFLLAIITAYISLFLESRVKYALSWRAFQVMQFNKKYFSFQDWVKVFAVIIYSIILSPRNLVFCRMYSSEDKKTYFANLNGKTVGWLAETYKLVLLIETITAVIFIYGLYLFIKSFA